MNEPSATASARARARLHRRDVVALLAGLLGPLAVAAALLPLRGHIANTDVALLLVLAVVGVAANGFRPAGWLTAVSVAVWFDFFWTRPYEQLVITARADIETFVLLLAVGVAVTEIAVWGRRQHARASREAGFRAGILAAAEAAATGDSPSAVIERVCAQLVPLLGLESARFVYGTGLDHPRLEHDGSVTWRGQIVDVQRDRLPQPPERPLELVVESGGAFRGRFLLTPRQEAHPTRTERLVAVALADQAGAALAGYQAAHRQ
jgi:K+-sensing histidine kinase KdpD